MYILNHQPYTYHHLRSVFFAVACFVALFTLASFAYGASDSFNVQTLIGTDTTPPSIPSNFTAVPVATTQIDLSWNASTDNLIVSGYHIWRDDLLLATTTALTFQDTGLTASTTYTYYVTAFDSFFNESASSTVLSTTTLSVYVPPPVATSTDSGTTYGTRIVRFESLIELLEILPSTHGATVHFVTDGYVRAVVKWGETPSYEMGSLVESAFMRDHRTFISGLVPGKQYYVTIEGELQNGRYGVLHSGTFTTTEPEDIFPPGNVTNLDAEKRDKGIELTWKNPLDDDFTKVRIIRNEKFYPNDTADGRVIYEGDGERVLDTEDTGGAKILYYTVFSYDALGNISSGAVVRYSKETGKTEVTPIDPAKNEVGLTQGDIIFSQEGKQLVWEDNRVRIDGVKQFSISIPYEALPRHLKTIYVVMQKGSGEAVQTFSFLLRVNDGRTAYTSTIAPLGTSGDFPVEISLFDFKTLQIGYVHGTIESRITQVYVEEEVIEDETFFGFLIRQPILWLVLILLFFLIFFKRRKKEEDIDHIAR